MFISAIIIVYHLCYYKGPFQVYHYVRELLSMCLYQSGVIFQACYWCVNCKEAKCVPADSPCHKAGQDCQVVNSSSTSLSSRGLQSSCFINKCEASTCMRCKEKGCHWSKRVKKNSSKRGSALLHIFIFNFIPSTY